MTGELFTKRNHRKFIPIIARRNSSISVPTWLEGAYYLDMSTEAKQPIEYKNLLATLTNRREEAPPLGIIKPIRKLDSPTKTNAGFVDVTIEGAIVDEVTKPKNDDSLGSALYNVPF